MLSFDKLGQVRSDFFMLHTDETSNVDANLISNEDEDDCIQDFNEADYRVMIAGIRSHNDVR